MSAIAPESCPSWAGIRKWRYRDPDGGLFCTVRRYDTEAGKEVRAWTYRTPGQWEPRKPPKPWPLLNLDLLAKDLGALVLVAEGEKAAQAAGKLGGIGTTAFNGSKGVKDTDLSALTDRDLILLPDADEPGRGYVLDLIPRLQGKARSLRIVDVWALGWQDGEDVADHPELRPEWVQEHAVPVAEWLGNHPQEKVRGEMKQGVDLVKERVEELAQLDPMAYELRRAGAAEELGVRASSLDEWVRRRRDEINPAQDGAGQALVLEDPEPWPEPVEGAELAQDLREMFVRHLVLPPGGPEVLVLWTLHTHAFEAADYSPHLLMVSAVKRSGKSTVLRVLKEVCSKSLSVEHATVSALFRSVERAQPTLLLDEADTYLAQDELLRGLLNSSFQRGGGVLRVEGDEREPRFFPTFTPTALASIKDLPGTIMDRALALRMKRKAPGEGVEKFRRSARSACLVLKRKAVRWARDNVEALADLNPRLPESLNDREADFWEPLFQLAARLGSEWEETAFRTAQILQGEEAADVADHGLELLADVRTLVQPHQLERFTSEWLRYELGTLEGKPWATFTDRGLISQMDLAKTLKPFGIRPKQLWMDERTTRRPEQAGKNFKGFTLTQFADAWIRYLGESVRADDDDDPPPSPSPRTRRLGHLEHLESPENPVPEAGEGPSLDPADEATSRARTDPLGDPGLDPVDPETACARGNPLGNPSPTPETGPETPFLEPLDGLDVYAGEMEEEGSPPAHAHIRASVPVRYLTDPEEARAELAALVSVGTVLGADTETTGLNPREDKLRLFQVSDEKSVLVIDLFKVGVPAREVLAPLADAALVFHNVQFDAGFLLAEGIRPRDLHCTQLEYAALTHDPMVSFKKACKETLGIDIPKELQRSDWSAPELDEDQIRYAGRDAYLTLVLHEALTEKIKAERMVRGFTLVRRCIPAIRDTQARGVLLDRERHEALVATWTEERDAALGSLRAVLGEGVNPESTPQLSEWLTSNLEPEVRASWPTTGKGQLATDKDTLEAFANVPLVQPLLNYRRVSHRLKTWGEGYQRHVTREGRMHPGFLLLGARTGRMSCRNPNVQNLPRDPVLRACFVAPDGFALLAADFSQIELRIAGLLSQDPVILAAYAEGKDLHREIVARVTGKPADQISKEERKLGKALNFGLLYGAGPQTFRTRAQVDYGITLSLHEAEQFKGVFDRTYSRLRWWQMEQQREGERTGRLRTVAGRTVSFYNPATCYTDSRNYPVQAGAADLQLLAIQRVHAALQEKGLPAYLVNFVHDELVLEVRGDVADEVSVLVSEQMTRAFLDLFKAYPGADALAHQLVEVGTGPNYAEVK